MVVETDHMEREVIRQIPSYTDEHNKHNYILYKARIRPWFSSSKRKENVDCSPIIYIIERLIVLEEKIEVGKALLF